MGHPFSLWSKHALALKVSLVNAWTDLPSICASFFEISICENVPAAIFGATSAGVQQNRTTGVVYRISKYGLEKRGSDHRDPGWPQGFVRLPPCLTSICWLPLESRDGPSTPGGSAAGVWCLVPTRPLWGQPAWQQRC